jgi:hypothetical protein
MLEFGFWLGDKGQKYLFTSFSNAITGKKKKHF